jgi:hypothetical protein
LHNSGLYPIVRDPLSRLNLGVLQPRGDRPSRRVSAGCLLALCQEPGERGRAAIKAKQLQWLVAQAGVCWVFAEPALVRPPAMNSRTSFLASEILGFIRPDSGKNKQSRADNSLLESASSGLSSKGLSQGVGPGSAAPSPSRVLDGYLTGGPLPEVGRKEFQVVKPMSVLDGYLTGEIRA